MNRASGHASTDQRPGVRSLFGSQNGILSVRLLTRAELTRHLDYSSELLALVSKLAALHAQDLQETVVLAAVTDVESLTADLSRKVWQKITILDVTAHTAEEQP